MIELVETAWRDGLGVDDGGDAARGGGGVARGGGVDGGGVDGGGGADAAAAALFGALRVLVVGVRAPVPAVAPPGAAYAVVHGAARVLDAVLAGAPVMTARAVEALELAIDALTAEDPRAIAALAWADLALGEVGLFTGELRAARHRFEAVAQAGRPVALRAAAMLQLAGLAVERSDLETARTWARKASTLAAAHGRPREAARAGLVLGLLDFAVGDAPAMRASLGAIEGEHAVIAQLLLAAAEPGAAAMPILAGLLRDAVERHDALAYALCVLIGARRYAAMGRPHDAQTTLAAGVTELRKVAPHLVNPLVEAGAAIAK